MLISAMSTSKFLKKEDVMGSPMLVTINGITEENVAMDDQPKEMKYCLHFLELDKPLVLNKTNIELCAEVCNSEETDEWQGKKIVLYNDETIKFQGKKTGGIRIRAAKNGLSKPSVVNADPAEVNRKLQEAADEADLKRGGVDQEF